MEENLASNVYDIGTCRCTYYRCIVGFSNFWCALFLLTSTKWFCYHCWMMRSVIIDVDLNFLSKSCNTFLDNYILYRHKETLNLNCILYIITYFLELSRRTISSSDDSVSSLSLNDASTFSYCNKRSSRKLLSLFTFSNFRCVERRASWKHSFSCDTIHSYFRNKGNADKITSNK